MRTRYLNMCIDSIDVHNLFLYINVSHHKIQSLIVFYTHLDLIFFGEVNRPTYCPSFTRMFLVKLVYSRAISAPRTNKVFIRMPQEG